MFSVILKQVYTQIVNTKLKSGINSFVLALVIFAIMFVNGALGGFLYQSVDARVKEELGDGQLWNKAYDPYDFETDVGDANGVMPKELLDNPEVLSILVEEGSAYPNMKNKPIKFYGVSTDKPDILAMDFSPLSKGIEGYVSIALGSRAAKNFGVKEGDEFFITWKPKKGYYDAFMAKVVKIYSVDSPAVDNGIIWIDRTKLEEMFKARDKVTYAVLKNSATLDLKKYNTDWIFKDKEFLLQDTYKAVEVRKVFTGVLINLVMIVVLLAVVDTQTIAIFNRRRELGIMMAMGMKKRHIATSLVIEGMTFGILGLLLATALMIPVGYNYVVNGLHLPVDTAEFGLSLGSIIYFQFDYWDMFKKVGFVFICLAVASYLPARRILKLSPIDAISGKI